MTSSARIVHGFAPTSVVDVVSRVLAERLSARWSSRVTVEHKPGADGRLATTRVRADRTDGNLMLVSPGSALTLTPSWDREAAPPPFEDLAPVSIIAWSRFAFAVGAAVPVLVDSLGAFVDWCHARPETTFTGNAGIGSLSHRMSNLLAREAGIDLQPLPYRGEAPAARAAAGAEVPCVLASETTIGPFERAGLLRVLATTGTSRSPFRPRTPTFLELGMPALAPSEWLAVFQPIETPAERIEAIAAAIHGALRDAEVRDVWRRLALEVDASSPAELFRRVRDEHEFWSMAAATDSPGG